MRQQELKGDIFFRKKFDEMHGTIESIRPKGILDTMNNLSQRHKSPYPRDTPRKEKSKRR